MFNYPDHNHLLLNPDHIYLPLKLPLNFTAKFFMALA